jgi:hypothetical protein
MDRKLWLLAVCVVGLILVAFGQKPAPKLDSVALSRYQLVPATVWESGEPTAKMFLIDTQDGRVWRYQPGGPTAAPNGNKGWFPDAMIAVGFGVPVLGQSSADMKKLPNEDR